MKFTAAKPLKENIHSLMKKAGYRFQEKKENELAFLRPPKGYPRFHLFIKTGGDSLFFNLHLDQKKPAYKGTPAHSGEYEGKIVEKEAKRIKSIL